VIVKNVRMEHLGCPAMTVLQEGWPRFRHRLKSHRNAAKELYILVVDSLKSGELEWADFAEVVTSREVGFIFLHREKMKQGLSGKWESVLRVFLIELSFRKV